MSKKIKNEQKKFLGETLNQYDKALSEGIEQLDKKNREQNHKISSLVNSFDNEFLEKDVEGNMTTLENSKDGMVIIDEIQGSTEVNYCKDGEKELILNGDIDTQGESFVTLTEGVDGGLVDVSLEGNTEINLSKTKDPVLVTREFDDINCNVGKLQYTIDDVTTVNDEPGKVDIDRIVGDTMVNHAVNGSEELILNAHINESGDNSIKLNGVTSDGGKVDVYLEGNTLVNVSNVKDDYITPTIEDKVDQGSVISLPEVSEGLVHIDEIEGNTLVNYCTDGAKELTLNGDIDVEGTFVTTTEGVDNGLVDVTLEGNTLVNLCQRKGANNTSLYLYGTSGAGKIDCSEIENGCKYTTLSDTDSFITVRLGAHTVMKPNTTYTLTFEIVKNTLNFDYHGITVNGTHDAFFGNGDNRVFYDGNFALTVGVKKISFTTPSDISTYTGFGYGLPNISNVTEPGMEFVIKNTMLLEGDWTDKEIPQYFEGMKSVGQDDVNGHKVEVLSRNKNEVNLPSYTYSFTNEKYGRYYLSFPMMGKTFSYRYDYEIISISEEQDNFYTNLAGSSYEHPNLVDLDFHIGVVDQRLYNGAKGTVVVDNVSADRGYMLREIRCIRTSTPVTMTYKITNFALYFSDNADTYIPYTENKKEILLNEPLRSLPNGVKDRFVKIGGKWFIERKCGILSINGSTSGWSGFWTSTFPFEGTSVFSATLLSYHSNFTICDKYRHVALESGEVGYITGRGEEGTIGFRVKNTTASTVEEWVNYLNTNEINIIYQLKTPIYEPLEIEPTLNTYNDTTHISNNSIIPCNMQIKNTGYNAIIKPNTLYTVALDTNKPGTIGINLGGAEVTTANNVAKITTPETLTDDSLRIFGKGIKGSKVRLLEGDKTNWIPSFFEGMKSSFEDKVQEDGSYKMEIMSKDGNLIDIKHQALINKASGMSCDFIIYKDLPCWQISAQSYTEYYNYFRCKYEQNTQYSLSFDCEMVDYNDDRVVVEISVIYTDGTIQIITIIKDTKRVEITTLPDKTVQRIRFQSWGYDGTLNMYNMQLIKGDTPKTTMEKSNKIQFSSIEPLRGVGDVHDRLVFKDGKLMIERNCRQENMSELNFAGDTSDTMKCLILFKSKPKAISNIFSNSRGYESATKGQMYVQERGNGMTYLWIPTDPMSREEFTSFLNEKNATIVYAKEEPTYEEIPYELQKIILESYNNGTLFIDTNIPPTKVSFNCFEEELTYLYPATSYTIQFISDKAISIDITLGGTQLLAQNIVKGLNRITITTPTTLTDNKLIINGAGAKISDVVVTDTNREFKYFEGMKSVGENGLKIYSGKPQRFGKGGRI